MSVFNKIDIIRLLLLSCLLTAAGFAHAQEGDAYTLINGSSLREGPGRESSTILQMNKDDRIIELMNSGDWKKVRVTMSGEIGWLPADILAADTAMSVSKESVDVLFRSIEPVYISQPLKMATVAPVMKLIAPVKKTTTLLAEAVVPEQTMAPVKKNVNGETVSPIFEDGAISSTATTVMPSETVAKPLKPVIEEKAATDEPTIAPLVLPIKLKSVQPIAMTLLSTSTPETQTALGSNNEVTTDDYLVTRTVNMRAGPDLTYETVAWARSGSLVQVLGRKDSWLRVRDLKSKRVGWVYKDFLQPNNAIKHADVARVDLTEKTELLQKEIPDPALKAVAQQEKMPLVLKSNVVPPASLQQPEKSAEVVSKIQEKTLANSFSLMQTTMIRKEPNTLSGMLGWASEGTRVKKIRQQGKWTKVRMLDSGRLGWIETISLVVADTKRLQRPVVKAAHQKIETSAVKRMIAADSKAEIAVAAQRNEIKNNLYTFNKKTKMRAGPNVEFDTVSWAGGGSKALELDRTGDWVRIQMLLSKRIGWVFHQTLDLISLGTDTSLAAATDHKQVDQLAETVKPAETVKLAETVKPATVEKVNVQVAKDDKQAQAAMTNMYRFNRKSNLRAGPGPKFDVVSWAGESASAVELGRKADWVRVQMLVSKRIGWVFSKSLELLKSGVSMPVLTALALSESKLEPKKQLYLFKQTSNLRAGPGKSFDRIAWGGRNESAHEIDHKGDWKRVRMTISGKVGWVFNSYLVRAVDTAYDKVKISSTQTSETKAGQSVRMYQVLRTEPLRADAGEFSELIASVQKGDSVAWLEESKGWVRVNPQVSGSKVGWIEAKLLKPILAQNFEYKHALVNKNNVVSYRNRISKGQTFNFSYAALEEALYKIPVEDIHIRIGKDDLKALFLKRQYDKSSFDIRLKTGRHNMRGTVKVLGSSTRIFKKKSLLIKLDKQSGRWYGHRRMALRSMASDKALMREWMTWKMMAAMGMKVPEVHFTRVSFNRGEKTGLYLSIEWMGPEFLEANRLDPRGEFYQPDDAAHCGDLYSTDQMALCFSKITPQNDDYSNLKAMATAVNEANADNIDEVLAEYFDDESIINWMAVNTLVTNGDTYNKNYWLYFHPSERKWTVIPWDYNLTYGRTYDQYSVKTFRIFNDNFQYYYPPDVGAGNPIKDKALRNPIMRARLEAKIKHLIGMEANGSEHTFGWFSPAVMHARIGNLASVVGKEVYKDTFLTYGEGDFTKTYESLMHYVTAHDHFLKVKLFGDFAWNPEPPNQPFIPMRLPDQLLGQGEIKLGGESVLMVDRGWGYFVARVDLQKPLKAKARFEVRIEGGIVPRYLPTGQSPRRCIERSWLLHTNTKKVSVVADVMFEYTQENSRRSEVPPSVHEELLELWMLDGNRWKPIQTEVNEYSNTLTAKDIHVKSGHKYRFVACSPF